MDYQVKVIKTRRRSISFVINGPGILTVRAPYYMSDAELERQLHIHKDWIEKHMDILMERQKNMPEIVPFTPQELENLAQTALKAVPPRVEYYAKQMGIDYGRITIRNQKTRWGSCSAKGNLNFNCLLMLVPERVRDYVIIHELCHRKEMNHSKDFWNQVERYMPDYREHKMWLKEHGADIISRLG